MVLDVELWLFNLHALHAAANWRAMGCLFGGLLEFGGSFLYRCQWAVRPAWNGTDVVWGKTEGGSQDRMQRY